MLVLSRQVGEAVMIGREIVVEVSNVDSEAISVTLVVRGRLVGGNGRGSSLPVGHGHVLHRNESCQLGSDISVTLVDVRLGEPGRKARLGINAPPHLAVHRREVFEAIDRESRRKQPRDN